MILQLSESLGRPPLFRWCAQIKIGPLIIIPNFREKTIVFCQNQAQNTSNISLRKTIKLKQLHQQN